MNQNWIIACFYRSAFLFILVCIPFSIHAYKVLDLFKDVDAWKAGKLTTLANYELYKTETIPYHRWVPGDKVERYIPSYYLVESVNSNQILMDIKGNTYWQRKLINRPEEFNNYLVNTYSMDDIDDRVVDWGHPINNKGTIALLTTDQNRWTLIDSTGSTTFLPPDSGAMQCYGYIAGKYWLFVQNDHPWDEDDTTGGYVYDGNPIRRLVYPDTSGFRYFISGNGYCLFKDDGSLYQQVSIPDSLKLKSFYMSPDASRIVYRYMNRNTKTWGIVYAMIDGDVIKKTSDYGFFYRFDMSCRFTSDGSYIIIQDHVEVGEILILSQKTGDVICTAFPHGYALTSDGVGYLAATGSFDFKEFIVVVYDLNKDQTVFLKSFPTGIEGGEINLSPDGKELDFVVQIGDKIEHLYYRLAR